jgi:uncharacterized protein YwgA
MKRTDWALIVIDEAGPGSLSPVQIQKTLFLISKRLPREAGRDFYKFVPYNYGPFNSEIYSDLTELVTAGLVKRIQYAGREWAGYQITEKGHQAAAKLQSQLNDRVLQYITRIVKWVMSVTFTQLLTAIYNAYPEYKAKSVFA